MRYVAIISILLCGCAHNMQPTDASVNLGGALKGAWGHTESAEYDVQQAKRLQLVPAGVDFLNAASAEHAATFASLTEALKSKSQEDAESSEARYYARKYHDDWFGGKFWRWFAWITSITTLVIVGLTVLHFLRGGTLLGLIPWSAVFRRAT